MTASRKSGRRLVAECNRLGIILDVSHINPAGFWDVLDESKSPVIATHSCVKALSPHVRNLDDEQIRALADQGGTIGINFANAFLRPDMKPDADTDLEALVAHFDYIVNLAGDEHVSFGSDFDGTVIPACVKDATGLPVVLRAFKQRGWSDDRLERICNGNFLRVAGGRVEVGFGRQPPKLSFLRQEESRRAPITTTTRLLQPAVELSLVDEKDCG